jgi:sterol desaturase/sphingolipid hydroxylase (fatty acid hydroxylase superfamily)
MALDASIQQIRIDQNVALPRYYDWRLHCVSNLLILALPEVAAFRALGQLAAIDAVLLTLLLFGWTLIEYVIHRGILHGSRFRGTALQEQHFAHHRYFTDRFMMLERPVDVNRVALFTTHLLTAVILVGALSTGLGLLAGRRTGLLCLSAGLLHVFLYEAAHAVSHIKRLSSLPGLRALALHHRVHHDPAAANGANFSITLPALDTLLGTRQRKEQFDA